MLRVIGEVQPRFVVGENVGGLVNWDRGMVFEQVQADLEAAGYELAAFILPACGKDAPHRRDRIWFVAHADRNTDRNFGEQNREANGLQAISRQAIHAREFIRTDTGNAANPSSGRQQTNNALRKPKSQFVTRIDGEDVFADTSDKGLQRSEINGGIGCSEQNGIEQPAGLFRPNWSQFPTQSPVCNRNDGLSFELADITFSKWRQESIKALGNAVVPQVVFEIFKAIDHMQTQHPDFHSKKE